MFFSLNKKFIYTISLFFIIISAIFLYTFYRVNLSQIQEKQKSVISRNQQYIEILYENITLRKELAALAEQNPEIIFSPKIETLTQNAQLNATQKQISQERQRSDEIIKSYNERYQSLEESFRILLISTFLFFLAMIVLWLLIKLWVLLPIEKLSQVSKLVAQGDYSSRISPNKYSLVQDEFDNLIKTFNQMLESIENSIREIHRAEFFLQSIIDAIPDGIRVLTEDGTIIIANKEYYKQINSSDDCIGQKCYFSSQNQNHPCPLSKFSCPLILFKEKRDTNLKFIQQFSAYPDRPLSVNAAYMTFKDEKHKEQSFIVESIRDLSEDVHFSHQQKISSLGFLSTSLAHEIKNNLGSIRMILEGLIKKYHKQESDEKTYLELIYKQLVECINVPERLLKLAQFTPNEKQRYTLNDSIQDIISILDYDTKNNGITINYTKGRKKISAQGNAADFKMVILNLMQNAIKAMPQGGEISISLKEDKEKLNAEIIISDTGIGIEADKLNHIFEPFYSEGHTTKNSGTGLGLAIVKSIIEKQNGHISVTSTLGKGTTFKIKIPLNYKK